MTIWQSYNIDMYSLPLQVASLSLGHWQAVKTEDEIKKYQTYDSQTSLRRSITIGSFFSTSGVYLDTNIDNIVMDVLYENCL